MDTKDLSASETQTALLAAEDRITSVKTPANAALAKETAILDAWEAEPAIAAAPKRLSPVLALKAGAAAAAESAAQGHDEQTALKTGATFVESLEVAAKTPGSPAVEKEPSKAAAAAPEAGGLLSGMADIAKNAYSASKEVVGDFISGVKEVTADPKGTAQKAGHELEDGYKALKELPASVMTEIASISAAMRQQVNGAPSHETASHAQPMAPSSSPIVATAGRSSGNGIG